MHKYLDIYGPFETLFGTIVWFNYESLLYAGKNPGLMGGGVSGLFNNPNYLGMRLTLCLRSHYLYYVLKELIKTN